MLRWFLLNTNPSGNWLAFILGLIGALAAVYGLYRLAMYILKEIRQADKSDPDKTGKIDQF